TAPGETTVRPFAATGVMTTASTGSAGLELRVETALLRRMGICVPTGAGCAIASSGSRRAAWRQIRTSLIRRQRSHTGCGLDAETRRRGEKNAEERGPSCARVG